MQRREGMDKHNQEGGWDTHLVPGLETCNNDDDEGAPHSFQTVGPIIVFSTRDLLYSSCNRQFVWLSGNGAARPFTPDLWTVHVSSRSWQLSGNRPARPSTPELWKIYLAGRSSQLSGNGAAKSLKAINAWSIKCTCGRKVLTAFRKWGCKVSKGH